MLPRRTLTRCEGTLGPQAVHKFRGSGERHQTRGDVLGPTGTAGGAGADHQDPVPQAHLPGAIQD